MELIVLAFVGGVFGCVLALPANGVTSATSGANFSELAFAFQITPSNLATGLVFAVVWAFRGGPRPAPPAPRLPTPPALRPPAPLPRPVPPVPPPTMAAS